MKYFLLLNQKYLINLTKMKYEEKKTITLELCLM